MNGAETLVKTMLSGGVNVCFANPGTSEMHFVAALDRHPEMRCILCLFEGGATGAADGYYRMTGQVPATLLHLAPGFGNGYANLHNAKKARSGIVNIVGDHAVWHQQYESPLKGDTAGISQTVSHFTRVSSDAAMVAQDGADAIRAARSKGGQIATLILPANTAWDEAVAPARVAAPPVLRQPTASHIERAAQALRQPGAALLIDGRALGEDLILIAAQIAALTGCRLLAPYFVPRIRRGAGTIKIERLAYIVEENSAVMARVKTLVLCGAHRPANFFAYPGKPSLPEAEGTHVFDLCAPDMDSAATLYALHRELGAQADAPREPLALPALPTGAMSLDKIGQALAALLPEDAIVVDEGITTSRFLTPPTKTARPHDWLCLMGGAIGSGLPLATGAAVACPDRKVVCLTGDGSAMYTLQCLWTMARENLDVVTLVFANRGYQILRLELANVGVNDVGRNAQRMFDVEGPVLDWVALAKGHGVAGTRVIDADGLVAALQAAFATPGPHLIEVVC